METLNIGSKMTPYIQGFVLYWETEETYGRMEEQGWKNETKQI